MTRTSPLSQSPAFRRRMRGVKMRAANGRRWETLRAERHHEIAAFEALPFGQGAFDLGQDKLNPLAGVGQFVVGQGAEGHGSHLVHELQGVGGVPGSQGGDAHQEPAEGVIFAGRIQKFMVRSGHALVEVQHCALQMGHALFKGLHRLLSVRLRCGEEAESSAEANPPPTTKRSADQ